MWGRRWWTANRPGQDSESRGSHAPRFTGEEPPRTQSAPDTCTGSARLSSQPGPYLGAPGWAGASRSLMCVLSHSEWRGLDEITPPSAPHGVLGIPQSIGALTMSGGRTCFRGTDGGHGEDADVHGSISTGTLGRVGKEVVRSPSDCRTPGILPGGRGLPFKTPRSRGWISAHPPGLSIAFS